MEKLIKKYDKPGPRYTSFPALPFWSNNLKNSKWIEHIGESICEEKGIDLYIHIPYCQKLCWYCGCNRIITKNRDKSNEYIKALKNEWNYYLDKFPDIKINSIHFGGGTPTFLPSVELESILDHFTSNKSSNFLGSIEIDPRTVDEEQIKILSNHGFNRASLGIQDFDILVQKNINRIQSFELVNDIVNLLKKHNFSSINFDLIFGLPGQTPETIKSTIKKVSILDPDLIAFYSYAHLPERIQNQKLINESLLPKSHQKRELYEVGKAELIKAGYHEIGMDHFAKESSYLYQAYNNKKLHRSFMGYTDRKSDVLIGLGATSISNTSQSFRQNEKDVSKYLDQVSTMNIPKAVTSHTMKSSDIKTFEIIQNLMCNGQAELSTIKDLKEWKHISNGLKEFESDGLITASENTISVTELGVIFVRNLCMIFDPYLGNKGAMRFSQTI